jgi:hypothetical protein
MTKQFNRHIEVRIIGKNDTLLINEELDIEFTCRKDRSTTPNEASVRIKNLGETSRNFIKANSRVEVLTGYQDERTLVMRMDVSRRATTWEPPDSVTRIEGLDGLIALKDREIKVSLAPKQTVKRGIDIIAKQAGLKIRLVGLGLNIPLLSGYTHSGKLTGALDDLTSIAKATWGIVDNELIIVKRGEGIGTPQFIISPENGLLAQPEVLDEVATTERVVKKNIQPKGYQITMLMRPNLNPFDKIEIQSRFVSGVFVVDEVEHQGSTRGGEYITRATVYESK